jgi:hypothetical protein
MGGNEMRLLSMMPKVELSGQNVVRAGRQLVQLRLERPDTQT